MTLRSSFLSFLPLKTVRFLGLLVFVLGVIGAFIPLAIAQESDVPTLVETEGSKVQAPSGDSLDSPSLKPKVPSLSEALGGGEPKDKTKTEDQDTKTVSPEPESAGMNLPIAPPKTAEENQMEMRGEAFETMMNGVLPLKPDELRDAFGRMDINQQAIEEPLQFPKPEISFTTISLDPSTEPLTFKLATGHVTTVSFLDITGQPWPIKDVTWAGNFEVKSSSQGVDEKFPMYPNLMRIIPMSEYAYGNMSIRLLGLATPLTFTLRTNKEVVQYRLDLRVPEQGPFAVPSVINASGGNTLKAGNASLTRIMEGIPPEQALRMKLEGVDGRTSAYVLNDMLYVRTPLTLLSPAWSESVRSADGMNVYALSTAPIPIIVRPGADGPGIGNGRARKRS